MGPGSLIDVTGCFSAFGFGAIFSREFGRYDSILILGFLIIEVKFRRRRKEETLLNLFGKRLFKKQ